MKKFYHFLCGLFEFTKIIMTVTTVFVFWLSVRALDIAEAAVANEYMGSVPWLAGLVSAVWAAYATVLSFAVKKSERENLQKHPDIQEPIQEKYTSAEENNKGDDY